MIDRTGIEYNLDDVGTRYQQYSELIEVWETGIEILERKRIQSPNDKYRIIQLRSSMELLRLTISGMGGYRSNIETLADHINMIPRSDQLEADKMPGDRGTPLARQWNGSDWSEYS